MTSTKKSALVLSGGAALGAAHIGVLASLEARGQEFDFISGVSAGAIIGALVACGYKSDKIWIILNETSLFRAMSDISLTAFGLVKGKRLHTLFERYLGDRTFKDLPIPFFVGVTDFDTGEPLMISDGKLTDAVHASMAVPFVFEPYFHPTLNKWLVDGGITQNLPLDIALTKYQGERILAVDVATSIAPLAHAPKRRITKLGRALNRTLRIVLKNQQSSLPIDKRVTWIRPDLSDYTAIDVFKLEKIKEQGAECASRIELSNEG